MRRVALLFLSLAACRLEERIAVSVPALDDGRSVIVALESDGSLYLLAEELEPDGRVHLPVALEPGASGRLDLMIFDRELETLDIRPGRLFHVEEEPRRALPEPLGHYVVRIEEGTASAVQPGVRSEALTNFRIASRGAPPPACRTLTSQQIDLRGDRWDPGWSGFEIAVSSTVALIGTSNHEIFRVTSEVERLAITPPDVDISAGSMDETGQLWFGDTGGSLWRGELGRVLRLELVATSTLGPIDVLAAGQANAFAIVLPYFGAPEAALVRYQGGRWRRLHRFCGPLECDLGDRFALERLGPDEAAALEIKGPDQRRHLVHYREGTLRRIPIPSRGFAFCVEKIAGFGTLVGADDTILSFDGGDRLEPLHHLPIFEVLAMAPFRDGLIIGAQRGFVTQLVPGVAACAVEPLGATDVARFVPLGDRIIAVGEPSQTARVVPISIIRSD